MKRLRGKVPALYRAIGGEIVSSMYEDRQDGGALALDVDEELGGEVGCVSCFDGGVQRCQDINAMAFFRLWPHLSDPTNIW